MGGRIMCNIRRIFHQDQRRRVPISPDDISLHMSSIHEQRRAQPIVSKYI